jgi:hypothetical protein
MTIYVSIGNSDDKLTQFQWASFQNDVSRALDAFGAHIHGQWYSAPDSAFQNACWCVEVGPRHIEGLRTRLARIAATYEQDSIVWARAETEFIEPTGDQP